jgi:hypothetical protein
VASNAQPAHTSPLALLRFSTLGTSILLLSLTEANCAAGIPFSCTYVFVIHTVIYCLNGGGWEHRPFLLSWCCTHFFSHLFFTSSWAILLGRCALPDAAATKILHCRKYLVKKRPINVNTNSMIPHTFNGFRTSTHMHTAIVALLPSRIRILLHVCVVPGLAHADIAQGISIMYLYSQATQ